MNRRRNWNAEKILIFAENTVGSSSSSSSLQHLLELLLKPLVPQLKNINTNNLMRWKKTAYGTRAFGNDSSSMSTLYSVKTSSSAAWHLILHIDVAFITTTTRP